MIDDMETRLRLALVRVATKPELRESDALEALFRDLAYHVRLIDDARRASVAETERNSRDNLRSFNAMQTRANNAELERDRAWAQTREQVARFNVIHAELTQLKSALATVRDIVGDYQPDTPEA